MRSEPFVSVCISSISKGSNIRLSLVQVMNWKGGWLSMWQWMIPLRWRGRYWMVGVYTTRLGSEIGLTMYNHVKWRQERKMFWWPWGVHKFKRDFEAKRLETKENLCILWKTEDKLWNICFHRQHISNIFTSNIWIYEVVLKCFPCVSLKFSCNKVFEFWRVKVILEY